MLDIQNQQKLLFVIATTTILTLHIPLLILFNEQDPNYETIRRGITMEGHKIIF